jgi:hypothetical protein
MAQQNRLMTMLEERNKPNPSEFFGAIARGFGDPNAKYFAQGAAGAAGNLNDLEDTNRARELQTAQMRMQLAQSQLGMAREDALGKMLLQQMNAGSGGAGSVGGTGAGGGSPPIPLAVADAVRRMIAGGDIAGANKYLSEFIAKESLTSDSVKTARAQIAMLPLGMARNAMETWANNALKGDPVVKAKLLADLGAARRNGDITQASYDLALRIANIDVTTGNPTVGNAPAGNPPLPTGGLTGGATNKSDSIRQNIASIERELKNSSLLPTAREILNKELKEQEGLLKSLPVAQGESRPAIAIDSTNMSPKQLGEVEAKSIQDRQTLIDKPWEQHRSDIFGWTPSVNKTGIRDLDELANIADKSPQVFNLLRGGGWWTALGAAAQEGIQAGRVGSFSIPVEKYIETKNLSPQDKINLNRAAKILANQFFENAKQNKSVLGPSISNSDTVLLKAPVATVSDPAKSIIYWAKEHSLFYLQRQELYRALHDWDEKVGAKRPLGSFFNSDQYNKISDSYDAQFKRLRADHSPVR